MASTVTAPTTHTPTTLSTTQGVNLRPCRSGPDAAVEQPCRGLRLLHRAWGRQVPGLAGLDRYRSEAGLIVPRQSGALSQCRRTTLLATSLDQTVAVYG